MNKWNYFYNELLYYIANRFEADMRHDAKRRVAKLASVPTIDLDFLKGQRDIWFNIMEYALAGGQMEMFLEAVIVEAGEPQDEYLIGALNSIRQGKTVTDRPLAPGQWKGGANYEVSKEKILGKKSTLLPIGFLEAGAEAAKAVVRIEVGDELGTGFIIEGNWLLTNNHVIPDYKAALKANIQFGYQYPKEVKSDEKLIRRVRPELEIDLDIGAAPGENFFTNEPEDWTLIRLPEALIDKIKPYGTLKFSEKPAKDGDFVNIIQHPLGGPKQLGIYNNMVMFADGDVVQYMTDTNDGSSGSPVMNSDWEVVALHHGGGWLPDPETKRQVKRNQGTAINKISTFLNNLQHNR